MLDDFFQQDTTLILKDYLLDSEQILESVCFFDKVFVPYEGAQAVVVMFSSRYQERKDPERQANCNLYSRHYLTRNASWVKQTGSNIDFIKGRTMRVIVIAVEETIFTVAGFYSIARDVHQP